jgi:hypothetical protein
MLIEKSVVEMFCAALFAFSIKDLNLSDIFRS